MVGALKLELGYDFNRGGLVASYYGITSISLFLRLIVSRAKTELVLRTET